MLTPSKFLASHAACFLLVTISSLEAQVVARDDASRYSTGSGPTGWINGGHQGDFGFAPWELESSAQSWAAAGSFIGDSIFAGGNINTGGKSFGLFANPAGSPTPFAAAVRKLAKPALVTGDTFSFKILVNFRNGNKGVTLRDTNGVEQWNFDVRDNAYSIRNGPSGSGRDDGQQLGGYSSNTIFTFTFTQRERALDWTIVRSGGISATRSGTLAMPSGSIADARFYISGTDAGGNAANNLYFNDFSLTSASRGDLPLTIGERRLPGWVPSYFLRFNDPVATNVSVRHGGDGFANSHQLTRGSDGVWSIDIRSVLTTPGGVPLQPGWHEFFFRLNSVQEAGANRRLYIDSQGRIAQPPAVYLTWQRDPTTTMTVQWFNTSAEQNQARYRLPGAAAWLTLGATTQAFPHTERSIHTAEITGLSPDTDYEFQVDGYDETFKFRTMPAALSRPVKFGQGGDVDIGATAEAMTAAIAAKDPDFLVIGGDHAYEDAKAENFWRWYRYMEAFYRHARSPDGRMIPLVMGIGNHEVRNYFVTEHPDFDNSAAWRDRYATYFYRTFAFPGPASPYRALDFGGYLSLLLMDTEHSSPVITGSDPQTQWLSTALDARRAVTHLIPVQHVPAYPSNRALNDAIPSRIRQHWVPLYEGAGVQLVFEHHDHTFKRTKPLLGGVENANGIRYVGDGLWGIGSRNPDTSRTYLDVANTRHHVHLVTLTAANRTVEAVDTAGNFFGGRLTQNADGLPPAPAPRLAALTINALTLSWSAVPQATKYKIIRSDGFSIETASTDYADLQWTPSSGFTYVVEAINRSGHSTNHPTTAPAPRQLWALANNLPWDGTGEGDLMADPNRNGRPNILEYFHGLNPRVAGGINPLATEIDPVSGELVLRFRRNRGATDVQQRVTWKSDLSAEGPWRSDSVTVSMDGPDPVESGVDWFRARLPLGADDPQTFMRLEVQAP